MENRTVESGSVWGCLNEILMNNTSNDATHNSVESEVDQYLAVPIINFKRSPYQWWENHKHQYYVLAWLTKKKYLSAPPTSVNSESFFWCWSIVQ